MKNQRITDVKAGLDFIYNNMPNIEEEIINKDASQCYVFFSSNGLFRGGGR